MKGNIVSSPDGEDIVLDDVGQRVLLEDPQVRLWDIGLLPEESQHWHLHHNPYVILSLQASPGRMDWLDGRPARYIDEYVGGSVYRPTGPVHRLTNVGSAQYRNRLIEFKELGENCGDRVDIGEGVRSVKGERPHLDPLPDGRECVLLHEHTKVWEIEVPRGQTRPLDLEAVPHVVAAFDAPALAEDPAGGVIIHPGGRLELANRQGQPARWFIVELTHLAGRRRVPAAEGEA